MFVKLSGGNPWLEIGKRVGGQFLGGALPGAIAGGGMGLGTTDVGSPFGNPGEPGIRLSLTGAALGGLSRLGGVRNLANTSRYMAAPLQGFQRSMAGSMAGTGLDMAASLSGNDQGERFAHIGAGLGAASGLANPFLLANARRAAGSAFSPLTANGPSTAVNSGLAGLNNRLGGGLESFGSKLNDSMLAVPMAPFRAGWNYLNKGSVGTAAGLGFGAAGSAAGRAGQVLGFGTAGVGGLMGAAHMLKGQVQQGVEQGGANLYANLMPQVAQDGELAIQDYLARNGLLGQDHQLVGPLGYIRNRLSQWANRPEAAA